MKSNRYALLFRILCHIFSSPKEIRVLFPSAPYLSSTCSSPYPHNPHPFSFFFFFLFFTIHHHHRHRHTLPLSCHLLSLTLSTHTRETPKNPGNVDRREIFPSHEKGGIHQKLLPLGGYSCPSRSILGPHVHHCSKGTWSMTPGTWLPQPNHVVLSVVVDFSSQLVQCRDRKKKKEGRWVSEMEVEEKQDGRRENEAR